MVYNPSQLTSVQGFIDTFRKRVLRAAGRCLRRDHPEYVAQLEADISEHGLGQVLSSFEEGGKVGGTFGMWRELLQGIHNMEVMAAQLVSSAKLQGVRPNDGFLTSCSMNAGSWVYYHSSMSDFMMYGLLEAAKELAKKAVRALVRPHNVHWQDVQTDINGLIEAMSDSVGKLRHAPAHGRVTSSAIEKFANLQTWEVAAILVTQENLLPENIEDAWVKPEVLMSNLPPQGQSEFYELAYLSSITCIDAVRKIFEALTAVIDWDKL